jgi:hypothetical protein
MTQDALEADGPKPGRHKRNRRLVVPDNRPARGERAGPATGLRGQARCAWSETLKATLP